MFIALFALIALVIGPVAPVMAVPVVADHCASMGAHPGSPKSDPASEHQCCASAMPSLPNRVAEIAQPMLLAPQRPVAEVPTMALLACTIIELRPPRTA